MESGWNIDVTRIYDLADRLAKDYKSELVNANAVATGTLANFSYDVDLRDAGLAVVFELPEYWYYIEEGRQPTRNPGDGTVLQRIRQWIEDKGIVPVPGADGKVPTLDSLAYAITDKLHKYGYFDLEGEHSKGKHLLRNTLDRNQQVIDEIEDEFVLQIEKPVLDEIDSLGK
jgi:hypothetical protein